MLVLTAVGTDRPGLVDGFTGFIHDCGGNIADTRMVNLAGRFAMIVLVQGSDQAVSQIQDQALETGREMGLEVTVVQQAVSASPTGGLPYRLKVFAMDQPGIVHRMTHLLHRHAVNIEDLQTTLEAGSYTGTPLFTMRLKMTVPTNVTVRALRAEIQSLCDELNCDLELSPA